MGRHESSFELQLGSHFLGQWAKPEGGKNCALLSVVLAVTDNVQKVRTRILSESMFFCSRSYPQLHLVGWTFCPATGKMKLWRVTSNRCMVACNVCHHAYACSVLHIHTCTWAGVEHTHMLLLLGKSHCCYCSTAVSARPPTQHILIQLFSVMQVCSHSKGPGIA